MPDGTRTWTVVDRDGLPLEEVEQFLDHHRVYSSPNTVKQYATGLGQ